MMTPRYARPCRIVREMHKAAWSLGLCDGSSSCDCRSCRIFDGLATRAAILAGQPRRTRAQRYGASYYSVVFTAPSC